MAGLFKPFIYEPYRHLHKLLNNGNYRTYSLLETRFSRTPRFTPRNLSLHGWELTIPDTASFLSAYKEIFVDQIYAFPFQGDSPTILDLGANIGLSVLFFKRLYPNARITAFEADPDIFSYLKRNIHGNGFSDVDLVNKAAWYENGKLAFNSEGADGGSVVAGSIPDMIEVEAVDIASVLEGKRFDFLKMDIEGAEEFVLPACKDHLENVRFIFVEYHSRAGTRQSLDAIIATLAAAGFRIHIQSIHSSAAPFVECIVESGFDLQLNVFGWRA